MIKELSNKIIFDDFVNKTILTSDELEILEMLIKKFSIVKISSELSMSDRNVSRIIKDLKIKYKNYKKLELAKNDIFNS